MNNSDKKTKTYQRPSGWGDDKLSSFMTTAEENAYATFQKQDCKKYYDKVNAINDAYWKAIEYMINSENWFELLFFVKAHGAFLAATRLGIATQAANTSPLIRNIIEYSLYGFFIYKNPDFKIIWINREKSDKDKEKVKGIFTSKTMIDALESTDPKLGKIARKLYDESIDYGAHPNERDLSMFLKITRSEKTVQLDVVHLTDDFNLINFSLKRIAQATLLSLKILQLIIPERVKIMGLDMELNKLQKDL